MQARVLERGCVAREQRSVGGECNFYIQVGQHAYQRGKILAARQSNGQRVDSFSFRFNNLGRGFGRRAQEYVTGVDALRNEKNFRVRIVKAMTFLFAYIDIALDPLGDPLSSAQIAAQCLGQERH